MRNDASADADSLAAEMTRRLEGFARGIIDTKTKIAALESHAIDIFVLGDALMNGIYVIDKDRIITASNHAYSEITGLWEHEYIGKPLSVVVEKYFYNNYSVADIALTNKKIATGIGRSKRTNRDLLVTAVPVLDADSNVQEVISVLRDITELVRMQEQLQSSIEKTELYWNELSYYRAQERDSAGFVCESRAMESVKTVISRVAPVDSTVLITGETGVGKEVVAREIHQRSRRKKNAYIKVNCAAIPAGLMESELFGYEKGAFTGAADRRKLGFFEMAGGGTLLLDEIGELPTDLQAKLLRVLQEREFCRVGGVDPIKCDVRVIATTNRDLAAEVARGAFRKDLYYRLSVVPIEIPPLRERPEDVPRLAAIFADRFNGEYGASKRFGSDALASLSRYPWPGNVRELSNVVERLMVVTPSVLISAADVAAVLGKECAEAGPTESTLKDAKEREEKRLLAAALAEAGSSRGAAKLLGIAQPTVIRKAKKYGIASW